MAEPDAPLTRTILVDCTVALEVTVQYDPLDDDTTISDVKPDWLNFQIGIPYWHPNLRMPNTEISGGVIQHLEHYLPRGVELRWNPTADQ